MAFGGTPVTGACSGVARPEWGVSEQRDDRSRGDEAGHPRADRAGSGTERALVAGPAGEEAREAAEQRGERQARELPVPVELGEGLEVQVVGVLDPEAGGTVVQPESLVAAGSSAEQRVRPRLAPSDMPELGTTVPGETEEPRVQVRACPGRLRDERVIRAPGDRRGRAVANSS